MVFFAAEMGETTKEWRLENQTRAQEQSPTGWNESYIFESVLGKKMHQIHPPTADPFCICFSGP